jgi:hypothetical protein
MKDQDRTVLHRQVVECLSKVEIVFIGSIGRHDVDFLKRPKPSAQKTSASMLGSD